MDLIYYYPSGSYGPSVVAKSLLNHLLSRKKKLPFEKIKLFVPIRDLEEMKEQFDDMEIITLKNINRKSKNCLIHIPVGPLIFPNSKFLLHLFAVFKRRKLILQEHGDTRTEMRIKWKYMHRLNLSYIPTYIFLPYLLKSADRLIVNSYWLSNLVRSKYGVKNEVVIPNAIDDFWFESVKENIELDGAPAIFYHGKLTPEKGIDILLKAFSKATNKHSKAKLYLAGGGSWKTYLRKLCAELGIKKNVMFLGHLEKEDIKVYLNNVDAAIYPSIWDNFPLAFMEAFSSANGPVYFSKAAGIYDFVVRDGYDLNAFEPTVNNVTEIIKDVIDGNYDEQIIKSQKEFAKGYTWDKVSSRYIKIYNDIVKARLHCEK